MTLLKKMIAKRPGYPGAGRQRQAGPWLTGAGSLLLLALLGACGQPAAVLPTTIPLAVLPEGTPTSSLPPTLDINSRVEAEAANTAVPVTRKPTPTATPVDPLINITDPSPNELLILGSEVTVRGLVQREADQAINVVLLTANGRSLAEQPGAPGEFGWEAKLTIPPNVSGAAALQANLLDASGGLLSQHQVPVLLILGDKETADRYLDLFRPKTLERGVSGFNLFFDGEAKFPVNNTISLSIWADDCQTRVARQNFVLGRSNRAVYWQGFVVIPRDLAGPACAVASFGEPGSESWREAQVPIEVLATGDGNARGVTIGNPPPDGQATAGEELLLFGTALNVSEGPVTVSILMEDGRVISGSSTTTDYWGYWETTVFLPIDVAGLAQITVSAGEGDTSAESEVRLTVLPAPTPTPLP